MKFCIYGAGAIGGYLAVELALSGQEVCVVARGAHLEAIRKQGLTLKIHGEQKVAKVAADSHAGAFENPCIETVFITHQLGCLIPIARRHVRIEHVRRLDDVVVDAEDDHVVNVHRGLLVAH